MAAVDMWDLISRGGLVAALLIYIVMGQREDIVSGKAYRREIDRATKADEQAERSRQLIERLLTAIETMDRMGRAK